MDRQTLRDWVHRYNAAGFPGLCHRPAPGRKPKLTEGQMAALKAVVLAGPNSSEKAQQAFKKGGLVTA
jgi:transposase